MLKYDRFSLDSSLASVIHSVTTEYHLKAYYIMKPRQRYSILIVCCLTEYAIKYSALASYVTYYTLTNNITKITNIS